MVKIPVVDIAPYSVSVPAELADSKEIRQLADEICKAFTTVGFVYLKNHGIPQNVVDEMFATSQTFFDKPIEVKQKYSRPADSNDGWVSLEREKLNPDRPAADLKEAYNMTLVDDHKRMPVDTMPNFFDVFKEMFVYAHELGNRVLNLMSIGLNIDSTFLRDCHKNAGKKGNASTLRSLYYPPISKDVKPGQVRCGEHSDYGSITLLFQDDIGGLEVKPVGADYTSATPIPGTVLVIIGDLMQRWTADKLVATKHRVLIPEKETMLKKGRQSIAFFVHPDDEVMITCLDGSGKYEEISSIDYLNMRFGLTYDK
uniref:UPF0676 protein C1494.01-like n=1 Tax=Crassostrea virginica TaxID=6565 RepID=A0A8B8A703_CRAVI|nr:UPF0676 protein C1494.01-like [Crassostrea virginica]